MAEFEQLAADALVTPKRVLPGQLSANILVVRPIGGNAQFSAPTASTQVACIGQVVSTGAGRAGNGMTRRRRHTSLHPGGHSSDRGSRAGENRAQHVVAIRIDTVVIVEPGVDVVAALDYVIPIARAVTRQVHHLRVEVGIRLLWQQRVLVAVQGDHGVLNVTSIRDRRDPSCQVRIG